MCGVHSSGSHVNYLQFISGRVHQPHITVFDNDGSFAVELVKIIKRWMVGGRLFDVVVVILTALHSRHT